MSTFPGPGGRSPARYRFLIEALLFLSYMVFGVSWIGYSPFLKEYQGLFELSHAQGSLIISAVSFAKIFMPFAAGYLAVRLGIRRTLSLGMICICASLFTPFAADYDQLLISRFVFGVGGAIVVTLIGSAVMQWFPARELPIVNGFNYVAVNSGISLSLFVTIPLAERLGRTHTLAAYAAVSLLVTLAWLIFGRDRGPAPAESLAGRRQREGYGTLLRWKETWFLALAFIGPLSLYLVFNTWLPTFYHQVMGMTNSQASQLTGLFNTVGIPAAIIGGILTRRTGVRKPFIWVSGIIMGVSAFGLFLTRDFSVLSVSAVLFGISLFLWISPLTTLAMELPWMTPARLGMVMGVFYSVSYIVAFLAPIIAGALRDETGSFLPGFVLFALTSWSLVVGGLLLPETGKNRGG
ncbi:MAG: CynX/NimT family MFS transporter [Acidobacteriota bacterium]